MTSWFQISKSPNFGWSINLPAERYGPFKNPEERDKANERIANGRMPHFSFEED